MERLTNKREADAQRKDYENRIKNGYRRPEVHGQWGSF